MYTATINQNGMILLNKDIRKALGLKLGDRVTINLEKDSARVARRMTDEDFFAKLDSMKSEKTKQMIKKYAGKSDDELLDIAMKKVARQELAGGEL